MHKHLQNLSVTGAKNENFPNTVCVRVTIFSEHMVPTKRKKNTAQCGERLKTFVSSTSSYRDSIKNPFIERTNVNDAGGKLPEFPHNASYALKIVIRNKSTERDECIRSRGELTSQIYIAGAAGRIIWNYSRQR